MGNEEVGDCCCCSSSVHNADYYTYYNAACRVALRHAIVVISEYTNFMQIFSLAAAISS